MVRVYFRGFLVLFRWGKSVGAGFATFASSPIPFEKILFFLAVRTNLLIDREGLA